MSFGIKPFLKGRVIFRNLYSEINSTWVQDKNTQVCLEPFLLKVLLFQECFYVPLLPLHAAGRALISDWSVSGCLRKFF